MLRPACSGAAGRAAFALLFLSLVSSCLFLHIRAPRPDVIHQDLSRGLFLDLQQADQPAPLGSDTNHPSYLLVHSVQQRHLVMLSYEKRPVLIQQPTAAPANRITIQPPPSATSITQRAMARSNGYASGLSDDDEARQYHHIWLITGPAGCGKSSVAEFLAQRMGLPYIEGDEFHPKANVEKMSRGIPLTDADRWDWLTVLREESLRRLHDGAQGVVMTCSALKRKYRDVIRVAPYYSHDVLVHFIYLHASESVLMERVQARKGHFMAADMVHSQFDILELPGREETDVITVDVSRSLEEVEVEALEKMRWVVEAAGTPPRSPSRSP